jgi:hypothetical protein
MVVGGGGIGSEETQTTRARAQDVGRQATPRRQEAPGSASARPTSTARASAPWVGRARHTASARTCLQPARSTLVRGRQRMLGTGKGPFWVSSDRVLGPGQPSSPASGGNRHSRAPAGHIRSHDPDREGPQSVDAPAGERVCGPLSFAGVADAHGSSPGPFVCSGKLRPSCRASRPLDRCRQAGPAQLRFARIPGRSPAAHLADERRLEARAPVTWKRSSAARNCSPIKMKAVHPPGRQNVTLSPGCSTFTLVLVFPRARWYSSGVPLSWGIVP